MSKGMRSQVEQTPAAERPMMFGMIKKMDNFTQVKVVKETKTADGVTLSVEAIDSGKKATATVDIVKENGAWKLGKETVVVFVGRPMIPRVTGVIPSVASRSPLTGDLLEVRGQVLQTESRGELVYPAHPVRSRVHKKAAQLG